LGLIVGLLLNQLLEFLNSIDKLPLGFELNLKPELIIGLTSEKELFDLKLKLFLLFINDELVTGIFEYRLLSDVISVFAGSDSFELIKAMPVLNFLVLLTIELNLIGFACISFDELSILAILSEFSDLSDN